MESLNAKAYHMVMWGGTQSAAIAALIIMGKLPKPDFAIMVDTEREKSGTWKYANDILIPALSSVGICLEIVKKSEFATVDLYSLSEQEILIPAFTNQSGIKGKLQTMCSNEWKLRVLQRKARSLGIKECINWVGISTDEIRRVRVSRLQWWENQYPLVFIHPMRRDGCIKTVESMGWPKPPRSSCWMCPNHDDGEWFEMKTDYPSDFQMAVEFERDARNIDPHLWLHRLCVPLDTIDFESLVKERNSSPLFDNICASGMCMV